MERETHLEWQRVALKAGGVEGVKGMAHATITPTDEALRNFLCLGEFQLVSGNFFCRTWLRLLTLSIVLAFPYTSAI